MSTPRTLSKYGESGEVDVTPGPHPTSTANGNLPEVGVSFCIVLPTISYHVIIGLTYVVFLKVSANVNYYIT